MLKRLFFSMCVLAGLLPIAAKAQIPELIYFKCNTSSGTSVTNEAQTGTRVSTNGTLVGTTIGGTGQFGAAWQGNGAAASTSNCLNANWPLNLTGPWTLSMWIGNLAPTQSCYFFGGSGGSTFRAMAGPTYVSNQAGIMVRATGMTDVHLQNVVTGAPIVVTLVYDPTGPNIRTYVNGVANVVVPQTATMTITGTDFLIGGYATNGGLPAGSLLDEIRLYNRALSATEVANTWNVDLLGGPPCPVPTGLNATNILSSSATVGWNAVPGSVGYEYKVDQNPTFTTGTPTSTTTNSGSVSGLLPGTTYYLHVRNLCSPTNPSFWVDYQFTTLPPCNDPSGFNTTNLLPNSVTLNWDPLLSALSWDYIVDQDRNDPASSTGATNVTVPTDGVTGLTEDTWYYVHIRANCTGEQSNWSLDSFQTPIPCRAPVVKIEHLNTDEAVGYWDPIKTAFEYEYAISTSATPPAQGTRYDQTAIHTSALKDGKQYFLHVRSHCNSLGTITFSPWTSASFITWPTGVVNINEQDFSIATYPNPVKNIMTMSITGAIKTGATAIITDVTGKALKTLQVTDHKTDIDISQLPTGNYLLKYSDGENNSILKISKI
jgi:hypothetical protein